MPFKIAQTHVKQAVSAEQTDAESGAFSPTGKLCTTYYFCISSTVEVFIMTSISLIPGAPT